MSMPMSQIVRNYGKMVADPSYYSNRGNNTDDLNSVHLEGVYTGIKTEIGAEAAKSFVQMVEKMTDDASASTFLTAMKRLEQSGWRMTKSVVPESQTETFADTIATIMERDGRKASFSASADGFLQMMTGMYSKPRPGDGLKITEDFLKNHTDEMAGPMPERKAGGGYSEFNF